MVRFKALTIGSIFGLALTTSAFAADPAEKWMPLPEFKQPFTHLVSGWYVRGDIGWRWQTIGSVDTPAPVATQWSLENVPTFGFGGGYKYQWFRMDATLDYATQARFRGDTSVTPEYYTAKIDTFTLLANLYLDLGTWGGFTPYVGAGVGTSNIRLHQYSNLSILSPDDGVNNTSRWDFSWAAMGGVAYQFTHNLVFDVSYRYLKIGDAMSGTEPPPYTTRSYFRDITAQEVRVGLRLLLD